MHRYVIAAVVGFLFSISSYADPQLRVRLQSDPQTFDWNIAHTSMETDIAMNIMEGLFEFDPQMKVRNALAESWKRSADGMTYTFKIKKDVHWSDGKPLTAFDFAYSWQRLLDPLTASPYSYFLFDIVNAREFNSRKITDFSLVGIKTIDPWTIEVKLDHPVGYFVQLFTFWVTFPVRRDLVEKFGQSWAKPGNVAVVGPFVPESYKPESTILLKRNERYYGKRPQLGSVVFRIVNEDTTAINLFKAEQLDFVSRVNLLELGELAKTPAFHSDPYFRTCFININVTKFPFNLPKVRQAFAQAINKKDLAAVLHQSVKPADSFVPSVILKEAAGLAIPFDAIAAKQSLKEVGMDASLLGKIELVGYASDDNALLLQYLQGQWKKNLGINVDVRMPDYKSYRAEMEMRTSPLYLRCWGADYPDPDSYLQILRSDSGNNWSGWRNAEYDNIVKDAALLVNGPQRSELYKKALRLILQDETPVIPLYYDQISYILNRKITNFRPNPLNYTYFRDVVFSN